MRYFLRLLSFISLVMGGELTAQSLQKEAGSTNKTTGHPLDGKMGIDLRVDSNQVYFDKDYLDKKDLVVGSVKALYRFPSFPFALGVSYREFRKEENADRIERYARLLGFVLGTDYFIGRTRLFLQGESGSGSIKVTAKPPLTPWKNSQAYQVAYEDLRIGATYHWPMIYAGVEAEFITLGSNIPNADGSDHYISRSASNLNAVVGILL